MKKKPTEVGFLWEVTKADASPRLITGTSGS